MAILNLGLANLALSLDPHMPEWIHKILHNCNSMKQVRVEIARYDNDLQKAIRAKERFEERRVARINHPTTQDDETEPEPEPTILDGNGMYKIGHSVRAFFDTYGWYEGNISNVNIDANDGKLYTIEFEDGDVYNWDHDEMIEHESQAAIGFGDVGWKFVKEFPSRGGGVMRCSDRVAEITQSNQRRCVFTDGETHCENPVLNIFMTSDSGVFKF